jgi:hypothetical protein
MKILLIIIAFILFSQNLGLSQTAEIKKSAKSGVCYTITSKSYKKLKVFTQYKAMDECIAAGGNIQKAAKNKRSV